MAAAIVGGVLLASVPPGLARQQPITAPVVTCPSAVLPLRSAAFQWSGPMEFGDGFFARDEFAWSQALVHAREGFGPIYLVTLAYRGGGAERMHLAVIDAAGATTLSRELPLDPPFGRGSPHALHPEYVVLELGPHEWTQVFPRPGRYTVVVSAATDEAPMLAADCVAEVRTWLLVSH